VNGCQYIDALPIEFDFSTCTKPFKSCFFQVEKGTLFTNLHYVDLEQSNNTVQVDKSHPASEDSSQNVSWFTHLSPLGSKGYSN